MLRIAKRAVCATVCSTVAAGLFAAAAFAGPIEDRQKAMEQVGDAMKILAAIAKKQQPFDAAVVKAEAEKAAAAFEKAKDLFPEGSDKGEKETYAKPEIWTDRATFDADLKKAHDAAVAMAAVTEEGQFMPALQALGGNCKGCHDRFRRPKE
ncbi:MAG: cytochrome c [Parvibaculaceae bacterium]